ncbi:MAG: sigma-54-dependent transcriptional regulator, partial [Candidatus Acidiferrales bacterium]
MTPSPLKPRIGIVESDDALRSRITRGIRGEFEILEASDFDGTYKLLQESELDVLLLGLPIPSGGAKECIELLQRLDGSDIDTLVIVLSSDEKKATALKVIDAGAYDYFIKPVDPDVLRALVERAIEKLHIQRENRILREEIQRKQAMGDLLGSTDAMRHVFDSIKRVARSSSTVIIRGESGTGKELAARSIHENSPRRGRPFISVNCAAIPESLMESELFGYEKGAFTGATASKEGRIELAQRGTLFLDEI